MSMATHRSRRRACQPLRAHARFKRRNAHRVDSHVRCAVALVVCCAQRSRWATPSARPARRASFGSTMRARARLRRPPRTGHTLALRRSRTTRLGATGTPSLAASTLTVTLAPSKPRRTRSRCAPVRPARPRKARARRDAVSARARALNRTRRHEPAGTHKHMQPCTHKHAHIDTHAPHIPVGIAARTLAHSWAGAAAATATPPTFSPPNGTGRVCSVCPARARARRLRALGSVHARPRALSEPSGALRVCMHRGA